MPKNGNPFPLLTALAEYPLPTIEELSPKPAHVLAIDEQLLANLPVDPFDVARTRKRRIVVDEVARALAPADSTMEVYAGDLQEVLDSEAAMVAVAPVLTPIPFASPAAVQVSEVHTSQASQSGRSGTRFLRVGAFAVAAVMAVLGGSAAAVASTPAKLSVGALRHAEVNVRTHAPKLPGHSTSPIVRK